ncbi:hypothetical protein [Leptospira bandrabouensis]|uniref:Gluconate 2-dehydrogenase subunit 3 family protein n=1 Tax=Leptospira bandrabouensis TaxID=2484903 RepID=A0A6H3P0Z2_9LEPT|nr:hypothetical protein [Leptospira bandrabouensis]MCG6145943.1 hypothetical protein [Leptospira bandrabouensis]MCG6153506.1 hypothetical protein [Leptospira bandrabouensis]MCG6165530.1 hypothetical protein [Leptospira bandrabouensis]MCW7460087.1 hypothetical protein [Leptospira bandrabouensis]MCW7478875.1 hypothetical protein [Leptospira bandrabouensis]
MNKLAISRKKFILGTFGFLGVYALGSHFITKSNRTLFLSKFQIRVIEKYLKATLPEEIFQSKLYERDLIQRIDEELFFVNESIQSEFMGAILLVEIYPLGKGYWSTFSNLDSKSAKEIILKGMQSSSLSVRAAFSTLRMLSFLIHYGQKDSWQKIGYSGPYGGFPEKLSESRIYYRNQTEG